MLGQIGILVVGASLIVAGTAANELSKSDAAKAKYLLDGLKDGRDRLVTGIFRATGRWHDDRPAMDMHHEGDVEMYCAFDFAQGFLRFDRSQVYPSELATTPDAQRRVTKYARTPEETYNWVGNPIVEVHPPGWFDPVHGTPFDIKVAGAGGGAEFMLASQFDELHASYLKDPLIAFSDEGNGIRHLTWLCGMGERRNVKRELWLDELHGFTSVHSETRFNKTGNQADWGEPRSSGDATWQEVAGVWVPKTWAVTVQKSTGPTSYELSFEWEAVNETVSSALFTPAGLEPQKGTLVVSNELGKGIVRETIGMPGFEHPQSTPPRQASAPLRWRIVAGSGVVLFCIAAYLVIRRRARA
jgi:hypothetical protein